MQDPAPHVAGGGITELRAAGIEVHVGTCEAEARRLVAPFVSLMTLGRPFVHAKWAMTLDGKIATRTGHSKWISNRQSRELVHKLRGRMDAIIVGAETALADDPLLTARPPGPRMATRIVVDAKAKLRSDSQLAQTARETPVLLATTRAADASQLKSLEELGIEVLHSEPAGLSRRDRPSGSQGVDLALLLQELGQRKMTNVLVEGGGTLLGSFFDAELIDEVHVVIAPKLVGGAEAVTPIGGTGLEQVPELSQLDAPSITLLGDDVYVNGRIRR
jgi:diaminohydroxyphosphoribosylaminopyrimidine deaminase/5-amino-6-(5-phosphoribosylamino)uracil reductase